MNDKLPKKYWNKIFRWRGGGYDGCIWEPNLGYSDKNGNYHPVISTGYDKIDDIPTLRQAIAEKLWVERYGDSFDRRMGFNSKDIQIESLSQEGFDAVCGTTRTDYMCELADRLNVDADVDGCVEMVCSKCGNHFASLDYSFMDICEIMYHNGYYRGDGGIGIITEDLWCDDCRNSHECSHCQNIDESVIDHSHQTFRNELVSEWLGVCDYCAGNFYDDCVGVDIKDRIDDVEQMLDKDKDKIEKYLSHMKENGMDYADLGRIRIQYEENHKKLRNSEINKIRDILEPLADDYFKYDASDWVKDRL